MNSSKFLKSVVIKGEETTISTYKPTKRWAKKNLDAVDKLIKLYKGGTERYAGGLETMFQCPLCTVNKDSIGNACPTCPWLVFKGNKQRQSRSYCLGYARYSLKKRIQRLQGWRIRFLNIINK